MIDFQGQDAKPVDGPCRTLGVDAGIGKHLHARVFLTEIAVNLLHQVGTVLIGTVDAALQFERLHRVDVGVAYDVLEVPLHGINPALQV